MAKQETNLKAIIAVLCIALVAAIGYIVFEIPKEPNDKRKKNVTSGGTNIVTEVRSSSLEPEATKRLHKGPVNVTSTFQLTGKGVVKKFGGFVSGNYSYTSQVVTESKVLKNNERRDGNIEVIEERKFLMARDNISLSDLDAGLSLCDTLPVEEVRDTALGISAVMMKFSPLDAAALVGYTETAYACMKKIDGKSLRGLLGDFGVTIPVEIEEYVNEKVKEVAEKKLPDIHNLIQSIEGKSFTIIYLQSAYGEPLYVTYKNKDGSPISDVEADILKKANLFIDSQLVKDRKCVVGDSWTVYADEMQELFEMTDEGRCEGEIKVSRISDDENGDWRLGFDNTTIYFESEDGDTMGACELIGGNALVDKDAHYAKSIQAVGKGGLSLNKERHILFYDFVQSTEGDAEWRSLLATTPVKPKQ